MDAKLLVLAILALHTTGQTSGYEFVATPKVLYVDSNKVPDVVLPCALTGTVSSRYVSVRWGKKQGDEPRVRVATGYHTEEPFTSTRRYKFVPEDTSMPNVHNYSLRITNPKPEDSGKYRCEVWQQEQDGKQTFKYDVTHTLSVIDPMESVTINGDINGGKTSYSFNSSATSLQYDSAKDGYFQCEVKGGNPPATLQVFVGNPERSVSGHLTRDTNSAVSLIGAVAGMKKFSTYIRVFSKKFKVKGEDDGTDIRCVAKIAHSDVRKEAVAQLSVVAKPIIVEDQCTKEVLADTSKTFAMLTCLIGGQPIPIIKWEAVRTGQMVLSNRGPVDFLEATSEIVGGRVLAKLKIGEISDRSFQEYKMIAENGRGETIAILQFRSASGPSTGAAQGVKSSRITVSVLTFVGLLITLLNVCT